MERLLIFHSENGPDCNTHNLVKTDDDKDLATLTYLRSIGNFAWNEDTTFLQDDVKGQNYIGLYARLKNLIDTGYNCFNLDTNYNITLAKFNSYYK